MAIADFSTRIAGTTALALLLGLHQAAPAATIDIVWYTYSAVGSNYRSQLEQVAQQAATDPLANGNRWNITWWEAGSAAPDFSRFDVLVTHSGEGFEAALPDQVGEGPVPGSRYPEFSTLLASSSAITAARGDRTAIVGSDLDYHSVVRASGRNTAAGCDPHGEAPTCDFFDGARGQLTNLIDWAGNGNGLGVVALFDGEFRRNGYWWAQPGSFLKDELQGTSYPFFHSGLLRENFPVLTAAQQDLPVNAHLSTTGLQNWTWSYHGGFTSLPTGYIAALDSSRYGDAVVLLSEATAYGALTSPVPEAGSAWLLLLGLGTLAAVGRRTAATRRDC